MIHGIEHAPSRHLPDRCDHCRRNRESPTSLESAPRWVRDAVFYQIFPDRFAASDRVVKPSNLEPWDGPPSIHGYKGGDLLGIVERLDYLAELGVTAIYLNPIFQSASNHRYHTHDYLQVDPLLGGDAAFDELLAACHDRGMRVVLDGVFNHASRGFFQFSDIAENHEQSPWRDWFNVREFPLTPYAEEEPPGYEAWWNMHALPKFNTANPQVREFLMRVAEHWVGRGIDGWRLDVPQEITTEGFWEELRRRVRAINQQAYLVGELWEDAPDWMGSRFDGVMHYQLGTAIIAYASGGDVAAELELDNPAYSFTHHADAGWFARRVAQLHDVYEPANALSHLVLLDSHDTARLHSIVRGEAASLRIAAALLMAMPGAPCLYYGTEIGLAGGKDPDNRRSFPSGEGELDLGLRGMWKELIAIRHAHPALRSGDVEARVSESLLVLERRASGETVVVTVNATHAPASGTVDLGGDPQRLWGTGADYAAGLVTMPSRSASMWRVR